MISAEDEAEGVNEEEARHWNHGNGGKSKRQEAHPKPLRIRHRCGPYCGRNATDREIQVFFYQKNRKTVIWIARIAFMSIMLQVEAVLA
jgi:hypothetical protein